MKKMLKSLTISQDLSKYPALCVICCQLIGVDLSKSVFCIFNYGVHCFITVSVSLFILFISPTFLFKFKFFLVCILGYEPDGPGGCKPCDKDWFREELSVPSCTACSSLDAAFVTETTGSDNSSLCGEIYRFLSN